MKINDALKNLLDYQRFEQNDELRLLIDETMERYPAELDSGEMELSDDELMLNAAGELQPTIHTQKKENETNTAKNKGWFG